MKKIILFAFALTTFGLLAQTDTATKPVKYWEHAGIYSLGLTQTSLNNWAAGGTNNTNVNALLKQRAVYEKNKSTWFNLLEVNLGYNFQPGVQIKTDDKVELTSRFDHHLNESKTWSMSAFANLKTQMLNGYSGSEDGDRISTFMAPAYATYGLGFTNKTVKGLTVYFSPITVKQTFVADSVLTFTDVFFDHTIKNSSAFINGRMRTEMGAYLDLMYNKKFNPTFEVTTKVNLFSNYIDRPGNIDVNWEALFLIKANKWLTASVLFNLIYDHDVLVQDTNGDGVNNAPGAQFKQVLGVGLSYSFGKIK